MSRKKKRRHPLDSGTDLEAPVAEHRPKVQREASESADEHLADLGDRVQARLDTDIGLDHSLPPEILRPAGQVLLLVGLAGLALTVPALWLNWSRLLVTTVGAFLVWVAATATLGNRNCESVWFTGGLLFVLGLVKWMGLPAFVGPGPGGLFLVGSACIYAIGALASAGARCGPSALIAREVAFVKLSEPFVDELADLCVDHRDARAPVVLQCRRCGVVFSSLADRLTISPISIDTLKGPDRAWMDINRCGANFEVLIEEPVVCRCAPQVSLTPVGRITESP